MNRRHEILHARWLISRWAEADLDAGADRHCPTCEGTGIFEDQPCATCAGIKEALYKVIDQLYEHGNRMERCPIKSARANRAAEQQRRRKRKRQAV